MRDSYVLRLYFPLNRPVYRFTARIVTPKECISFSTLRIAYFQNFGIASGEHNQRFVCRLGNSVNRHGGCSGRIRKIHLRRYVCSSNVVFIIWFIESYCPRLMVCVTGVSQFATVITALISCPTRPEMLIETR